jgi:hypothetical protein
MEIISAAGRISGTRLGMRAVPSRIATFAKIGHRQLRSTVRPCSQSRIVDGLIARSDLFSKADRAGVRIDVRSLRRLGLDPGFLAVRVCLPGEGLLVRLIGRIAPPNKPTLPVPVG